MYIKLLPSAWQFAKGFTTLKVVNNINTVNFNNKLSLLLIVDIYSAFMPILYEEHTSVSEIA